VKSESEVNLASSRKADAWARSIWTALRSSKSELRPTHFCCSRAGFSSKKTTEEKHRSGKKLTKTRLSQPEEAAELRQSFKNKWHQKNQTKEGNAWARGIPTERQQQQGKSAEEISPSSVTCRRPKSLAEKKTATQKGDLALC
jgi:hypothetical protein